MVMRFRKSAKKTESNIVRRKKFWPDLQDEDLWIRTQRKGFTTIPRPMPLIMQIMDQLSKKTKPVSSTYLELWCRSFDDCFVTLNNQAVLAFHSGFEGQRALATWRGRLDILNELGFIDLKPGPNGEMSYALILNPFHVIKKLYEEKRIAEGIYNALIDRMIEIKATDFDKKEKTYLQKIMPNGWDTNKIIGGQ